MSEIIDALILGLLVAIWCLGIGISGVLFIALLDASDKKDDEERRKR